jgi:hypothetical protein
MYGVQETCVLLAGYCAELHDPAPLIDLLDGNVLPGMKLIPFSHASMAAALAAAEFVLDPKIAGASLSLCRFALTDWLSAAWLLDPRTDCAYKFRALCEQYIPGGTRTVLALM